ncbi:winged helix DNA-binding domain-containing protein [Spongiactinospora gelatinilytica]|uniref:Winged helix DNA-binding domain-containing protein n=1 Tax=Spongiactinospora gelatinilytica TaxID=2666298 RepID=A0A2W2H6V2_9ACTN|nr:winged helix DNA-binding domain-containing protein [Spongiactinospora gelatinilytica]PZG50599.1 winged helix DNA-binding domain-containing protein [Spongiactinospora gelatinilytica]
MLTQELIRRMRAHAQALANGVRETSAEAVVRRVFAIQAQDATAADLGIRVRGRDISAEDVRAAYEDERSIVRGWFMRGTLHTVPSADARRLLRLLAPRILAATGSRYHRLGLDGGTRERADRLLRRVLATHGPLTRAELTEHLAAVGVRPEGQAPFHLIRHATLTGVLCHGPRRGDEATYVLLDDWLPAVAGDPAWGSAGGSAWEEDTAAAELARHYLRAHAPAGVNDFAAWSGLPITLARRAWKTVARTGSITEYGTLSVPAGRKAEPPGIPATPDVRLLPAYDNYLVGYRTSESSIPAAHLGRSRPGGGVIRPTVLADGLAIATWTRRDAGRRVEVDAFEPLSSQVQALIDTEASAVTRFLQSTT